MKNQPNASKILQKCHLFAETGPEIREILAGMALVKRYPRGRLIFRQDDPAPGIFVMASGMVRLYKVAPSGKEHVLHLAGPGDTFAEVAVIGPFPCPANAEALEASVCLLLPAQPFLQALGESHDMCLQVMGGMATWVRQLVGLMEGLVLRDASGRVARYLIAAGGDRQPAVRLPGRKRDIASHLNMTSESFSRALRHLRESDLIEERKDSRIAILNPQALRAVAEDLFPEI